MSDYVEACIREVRLAVAEGMALADTVYFGGGTPSQLPPDLLCAILDAVPRRPDAEVTVECNPDDIDSSMLAAYRDAGVARVSIGVQSTNPDVLMALGRRQRLASVAEAVAEVGSAGFRSLSVDLVYGGAGESDEDWLRCLDDVLRLDPAPTHVSAYALTVEPGTALAADPSRHPDDDVQARRYVLADEVLGGAGFSWYEISNWARPGHECRHNLVYWSLGSYRGIGAAAHSHDRGARWWNLRTPERYIEAVRAGRSPVAANEVLSVEQRILEAVALGLRTRAGIPLSWVEPSSELDGLAEEKEKSLVLTRRGRLLANEVVARIRPRREAVSAYLEASAIC